MDKGVWWAIVHGVADSCLWGHKESDTTVHTVGKSQTQLTFLLEQDVIENRNATSIFVPGRKMHTFLARFTLAWILNYMVKSNLD